MAHFPVERVAPALRHIVPPENYAHVFGWRRPLEQPKPVPSPAVA
jgi:hypothetical protein